MHSRSLIYLFWVFGLASCQPFEAKKQNVPDIPFVFDARFTVDPNCMDKEEYNACVFLKNPFFQQSHINKIENGSFDSSATGQSVGLNLKVKNNGPFLENETIQVHTVRGSRAQSNENEWKFPIEQLDDDFFGQVMGYFWLTYAAYEAEKRTGIFWAKDKEIRLLINDEFSGWSPSRNTIHAEKQKNQKNLTHNAGILIYYLGLANLHHASEGKINRLDNFDSHRSCGKSVNKERHCCKVRNGCAMAIASGAADYFVAMTFPESPTLGENWVARKTGLQACGLSRDLNDNKELTLDQAFQACAADSGEGYIYPMGTLYASIFWQLRSANDATEIDKLYQHHLRRLNSNDDFISAFRKIQQTDQDLFEGKHLPQIREEFERRGFTNLP